MTLPQSSEPSETAGETAETLLANLRRLCEDKRIAIGLDAKRLMHMDSPVHFEAESNRWVYGFLAITALVWWQLGWKPGAAVAVLSVIFYLTVAKAFLHRQIDRRVREQVLADIVRWRKLWNFGGVILTGTGGTAEGSSCKAPRGNWMEFVRRFRDG